MALNGSFNTGPTTYSLSGRSAQIDIPLLRLNWSAVQSSSTNTSTITFEVVSTAPPPRIRSYQKGEQEYYFARHVFEFNGETEQLDAKLAFYPKVTFDYLKPINSAPIVGEYEPNSVRFTRVVKHQSDGRIGTLQGSIFYDQLSYLTPPRYLERFSEFDRTLTHNFSYKSDSLSFSIDLDSIKRKSELVGEEVWDMSGSIILSAAAPMGTIARHNWVLKQGSTMIATKSGGDDWDLSSLTVEQKQAIYRTKTNGMLQTLVVELTTMDNTGYNHGTSSKTITARFPSNLIPTVGAISTVETDSRLLPIYNSSKYLRHYSRPRVSVTGSSGAHGSTIVKTEIIFNRTTHVSSSVVLDNVNVVGSQVVNVQVTDSRGQIATKQASLLFEDYSQPTISRFQPNRSEGGSGTTVTADLTVGSQVMTIGGVNKNPHTIKIYKKELGAASWGNAVYSAVGTRDSTTTTASIGSYDASLNYELKLDVSDLFMTVSTIFLLGTGKSFIDFYKDKAVAIGQRVATNNSAILQVNGEAQFASHIKVLGGAPVGHYGQSSVTDIDTAFTSGIYTVTTSTRNQPNGTRSFGYLEVIVAGETSASQYNSNNNWIWQKFTNTNGEVYTRRRSGSSNWTSWIRGKDV